MKLFSSNVRIFSRFIASEMADCARVDTIMILVQAYFKTYAATLQLRTHQTIIVMRERCYLAKVIQQLSSVTLNYSDQPISCSYVCNYDPCIYVHKGYSSQQIIYMYFIMYTYITLDICNVPYN